MSFVPRPQHGKTRSVRAIGAGPWRPLNFIVKLQSVPAFAVDRPQPRFEQRVFSVTFFVRNGSSTLTRATPHTFSIDEFFCQCRSFPRNQNPPAYAASPTRAMSILSSFGIKHSRRDQMPRTCHENLAFAKRGLDLSLACCRCNASLLRMRSVLRETRWR
jgi:hypothetical protein